MLLTTDFARSRFTAAQHTSRAQAAVLLSGERSGTP
jgi:hypothetical protein